MAEKMALDTVGELMQRLSAESVRQPGGKMEFAGGGMFRLIAALRDQQREDIANLLRIGKVRDFREAERRLARVLSEGNCEPLAFAIEGILSFVRSRTLVPVRNTDDHPSQQSDFFTDPTIGRLPLTVHPDDRNHHGVHRLTRPSGLQSQVNPWREDLFTRGKDELPFRVPGFVDHCGVPTINIDPRYRLKHADARVRSFPSPVTNRLGSKKNLMAEYDDPKRPLLPPVRLKTFIDVFGGSLAVLAYMVKTGRVGPETKTIISEIHPDLYAVYVAIQKDVEKLILHLNNLQRYQSKMMYERLKGEFNRARDLRLKEDVVEMAARYIFLLATCYGSVLRQNSTSGHINVICRANIGRIKIFDPENLKAMHSVLQNATIVNGSYLESLALLEDSERAFVFMDPPYHSQETTKEYGVPDFTEFDQKALADFFFTLQQKGIWAAVTNSGTDFIRDLYSHAPTMQEVVVKDALANNGGVGKERMELFIANYGLW